MLVVFIIQLLPNQASIPLGSGAKILTFVHLSLLQFYVQEILQSKPLSSEHSISNQWVWTMGFQICCPVEFSSCFQNHSIVDYPAKIYQCHHKRLLSWRVYMVLSNMTKYVLYGWLDPVFPGRVLPILSLLPPVSCFATMNPG